MAIRSIVTLDSPNARVLREKAKRVSRFDASLQRMVQDMWETMRDAPGVGLAAPQIGASLRVLVAEYEEEKVVLINPEVLSMEGEVKGTEGCLSIPGYVGENIRRAESISIRAKDEHGKPIKIKTSGWFARILQHEIDHLDGILFLDRLDSKKDLLEVGEDELDEKLAPR